MPGLKLIFAGTPEFAAQHLAVLVAEGHHKVIAAYTQPDRRSGRGKKLSPSPVKILAAAQNIPIYQPLSLKDPDIQRQMAELKADLLVVVAYGLILPKAVLDIPRLGCVNVHASLLPRWRGAAPIQRAIEAGDSRTGVTIMQMDEGLDTGAMLSRVACDISELSTAQSLQDDLSAIGTKALLATLSTFEELDQVPVAEQQDESLATYAHKITKQEACVDWTQSASTLGFRIRAFNPAPVAYTIINGQRMRIWQASPLSGDHRQVPGTVLSCDKEGLLVACGEGGLMLSEIQLPGKRRMAVSEAIQGRAELFASGTCLGN